MVQGESDQQAPDAAVPIEKRMDRFKLHVCQRGFHQCGIGCVLVMDEALQRCHAVFDMGRRRRDEMSIAWTRAADPILRTTEFAGGLLTAPSSRQEHLMHFPHQPVGKRKAVAQPRHAVFQCGDIARDFHHVIEEHTGRLL
jgi:hypothetical protein